MTVIENQTTIACTPEELFDYCVDIRNETRLFSTQPQATMRSPN